MKGGKPRTLKKNNRRVVLDLLRNSGEMTVAEISERVSLSKTTIMKIIDYLTGTGYVVSAGKGSSTQEGGKRPEIYKFNAQAGFVIGIHIYPREIYAAITDLGATILHDISLPVAANEQLDSALEKMATICNQLMKSCNHTGLIGIGIGSNGVTNFDQGIIQYSPHFPSWGTQIPLADLLKDKLGYNVPIVVENDCRFQVLSEKAFGMARKHSSVIAVEAGGGLGAGIMINDDLERGAHYLAGEIGHMIVNPKTTEKCSCGGQGCFEVMVSTRRLLRKAAERQDPQSLIFKGGSSSDLVPRAIFDAANSGDKLAQEIMDDIINWFAIGFSNLIMTFDPEIIVIHGIYTQAGDYFLNGLRQKIGSISLSSISKDVKIEYSNLGKERGVLGAAVYTINDYFNNWAS